VAIAINRIYTAIGNNAQRTKIPFAYLAAQPALSEIEVWNSKKNPALAGSID
jgi:hypothetical protein